MMLHIRIPLVVLAVLASLCVAPGAYAGTTSTLETVATESFDYTAGSNLTGLNGGTGWLGGWNADYGSSYLVVDANSLSVPGLTGTGGSAAWGGSFNMVAANGRDLASRLSSGVVWVQVMGTFNQSGGGTPTLRMFDAGSMNYYLGGNVSSTWSVATGSGSVTASSATPVNSGTHIAAYRINMDTRRIEVWTDFNPSTFNYLSPPTAEASMTADIALAFDRIALYSRPGGVWDELKIMRVNTTTTYDLVYDANGASAGNVPTTVTGTGPQSVAANTGGLVRAGFDFVGWSLSPDGSSPLAPNSTVTLNQNITLFASWEKSIPPMIPSGLPVLSFRGDQVMCESPAYSKDILGAELTISLDGKVLGTVERKSAPWTLTATVPAKSVGVLSCLVTARGDRATGSVATDITVPLAVPSSSVISPVTTGVNSAQCSKKSVTLGFRPMGSTVRNAGAMSSAPSSQCRLTITVTGYVQPTSSTVNDRPLALARARAAALIVKQMYPQATVVLKAGLAQRVSACAATENRCAVISFAQS